MQRLTAGLLALLTLVVVVIGARQGATADRLDEIACLERIHATAAVTLLVPDASVDADGRVDAVRTLSEQLDAC